jgi:hypothetical protein
MVGTVANRQTGIVPPINYTRPSVLAYFKDMRAVVLLRSGTMSYS